MDEFDISRHTGLTDAEAAERLARDGFNELPSARGRAVWTIAWDVVREPMFLLLITGGAIYLLLGDLQEALMLLGFVFVVMGITFHQERKTERALEALRDLSSPRALVIREGRKKRIAGRDVVRGDIVLIQEGDRVPADGELLAGINVAVDESLLTGESVPVRKTPSEGSAAEMARPGGDDLPFVFSGSMVVQGQGIARVREIGANTEIGRIGKALQTLEPEDTPLQRETRRLVRILAAIGLSLCIVVVVVYGITRHDWLHGFLAGVSLAMAVLPEEFPVVLTIFLALGGWRLSRKNVLTRRVPAVETLGAATVLCVDKTGTLTQNRMAIRRLYADGSTLEVRDHDVNNLPEEFHLLVEYGILASQRDPFDPMDKAFREFGDRTLSETEHLHGDWSLVREYALSRQMLALSHAWRSPEGDQYVIAAKGAPEAVADLCHLSEAETDDLAREVRAMADDGLRVLGVARALFPILPLPGEQHDFEFELVGLVGLADPIRPTLPAALRECYDAGIRVVMVTGDYAGTAQSIARQIGLASPEKVITGPQIEGMDDAALRDSVNGVSIFARMVPEQKLRLVNALKARGEAVAMTGDGVNDAPALKSAHIGVAMGERGTDVAREAADLVLLDDDFSSIVQAVKVGRRIFDNIRKAMAYIFAIHVPIAGMSLIPVLFKWPLVLMPVHIVFLELIIDPVCSIVFEAEPEEADVMRRPPRDPMAPLFSARTVGLSVMQGVGVLLAVLAVFSVTLWRGASETEARAMAFTTLIVANLGLILVNRSWSRSALSSLRNGNTALWWVMGGATALLAAVLYTPGLRTLFRFAPLHTADVALCLAIGSLSLLWFEILKAFSHHRNVALG